MLRAVCEKYGRAVCAKVVAKDSRIGWAMCAKVVAKDSQTGWAVHAKVFKVVILISHQIIYLFIVFIQLKVLCVS